MFDFYFLGLYGLFWQTLVILAAASILLLASLRDATSRFRFGVAVAAVAVFAPLTWLNWWVTSGDPEPTPDAGSNVGSDLHYASLFIIVVLLVLFIVSTRAWVARHPAPSQSSGATS